MQICYLIYYFFNCFCGFPPQVQVNISERTISLKVDNYPALEQIIETGSFEISNNISFAYLGGMDIETLERFRTLHQIRNQTSFKGNYQTIK